MASLTLAFTLSPTILPAMPAVYAPGSASVHTMLDTAAALGSASTTSPMRTSISLPSRTLVTMSPLIAVPATGAYRTMPW